MGGRCFLQLSRCRRVSHASIARHLAHGTNRLRQGVLFRGRAAEHASRTICSDARRSETDRIHRVGRNGYNTGVWGCSSVRLLGTAQFTRIWSCIRARPRYAGASLPSTFQAASSARVVLFLHKLCTDSFCVGDRLTSEEIHKRSYWFSCKLLMHCFFVCLKPSFRPLEPHLMIFLPRISPPPALLASSLLFAGGCSCSGPLRGLQPRGPTSVHGSNIRPHEAQLQQLHKRSFAVSSRQGDPRMSVSDLVAGWNRVRFQWISVVAALAHHRHDVRGVAFDLTLSRTPTCMPVLFIPPAFLPSALVDPRFAHTLQTSSAYRRKCSIRQWGECSGRSWNR